MEATSTQPMSMIGNLRRATDTEVARLLANPGEIRTFLYGEPDGYEDRAIEYLAGNYAALWTYVEALARDGLGMLVYIN